MRNSKIVADIKEEVRDCFPVRILIAGPCAVGKTTISSELAHTISTISHIEHDLLKANSSSAGKPSPCSVSNLNLQACFEDEIEASGGSFIIDIGGDAVFRKNANNDQRGDQLAAFKQRYEIKVVLLTSSKETLRTRFEGSRDSQAIHFENVWNIWCQTELPNWRKYADIEIKVDDYE